MRSNGLPVYNYCCVVDDMLMKISHVIRAEDHLSNTVRQLMLYEAFETTPPIFAHVSLLIGMDRQKLSKRHGATSVRQYRDDGYLPVALNNYLFLLGCSHPDSIDVFDPNSLIGRFQLDRFIKAAAVYDIDKLDFINGQHLRQISGRDIYQLLREKYQLLERQPNHKIWKNLESMSESWGYQVVEFLKTQVNRIPQLPPLMFHVLKNPKDFTEFSEEEKIFLESQRTSLFTLGKLLHSFIRTWLKDQEFLTDEQFKNLIKTLSDQSGLKGKNLFLPIRFLLTHEIQGGELKDLIPLTPLDLVFHRIEKILQLVDKSIKV
jgi:nondiscriminating glutamyl-tRNA synthetase